MIRTIAKSIIIDKGGRFERDFQVMRTDGGLVTIDDVSDITAFIQKTIQIDTIIDFDVELINEGIDGQFRLIMDASKSASIPTHGNWFFKVFYSDDEDTYTAYYGTANIRIGVI